MDASYQKSAPENFNYSDSSQILFNERTENFIFLTTIESLSYNDVPYPHFPQYNTNKTVFIVPLLSFEALYAIGKDHY